MEIVFFSRRFYPQIGGVESHVLELCRKLVDHGHEITVITEYPLDHVEYKKLVDKFERINILRIMGGGEGRLKKFRVWYKLFKIRKIIQNADIIHCHDVFFWYLPFRFIYLTKKVFTTFHGYEGICPPKKSAIIMRKISEKLSKGNICVGDYISKWYGTRPDFVIYGGVRITNDKLQITNNLIPRILLIGRLENDIGVQTYSHALGLLKQKKIKFIFKACGEGVLAGKLKKYGKVYRFTKKINNIIKQSDIVFVSSYLLILEALIAKKIVIAVFENPLKEDYLKMSPFSNFIFICKDASEILEVMKDTKQNSWKNRAMIENGYSWARNQTWEKIADTYLKLWKL